MAASSDFITSFEDDKDLLLTRVNQLVFVDGVVGFECGRCERTLIRHYIASCGHKFCANCRRVLTVSKGNCPLAHCKKPIENIDLQDVEFERKLYALRAHCPNKTYGCPFVSPLKDLGGHLRTCKDTRDNALPVLIPGENIVEAILRELSNKFDKLSADVKQIKEDTSKSFKDIETKLENSLTEFDIKLKKIETKVDNSLLEINEKDNIKIWKLESLEKTMKDMASAQEAKLAETSVRMTQQIEVLKQEMDYMASNLKEKMEQLILPSSSSKFDEKLTEWKAEKTKLKEIRKQQNKFLIQFNESNALNALEQIGFNLERFIKLRFTQMNCRTLTENEGNFQPDFTWKINGIMEKVKQVGVELESEVFEWTGYPIKAQAKLKLHSVDIVVMSLCLEEHNKGEAIDLKPIPQVYYVLRDRTKTNNPNHLCGFNVNNLKRKFDYSIKFNSIFSHKSKSIGPPYNLDDSIVIDIYVGPQEMSREVYSYDGTLVWALDNYHKSKEIVKDKLVFYQQSPYFYTGPKGYRVQVNIRFTYSRMVAFINFMSGEFNADLPMTFRHRTNITLFSHKALQRNFTKTIEKDITTENNFATIDLCSIDEVENYLLNDTLFYKVTIELLK